MTMKRSDNTSGHTGAYAFRGKWRATYGSQRLHLGVFDTPQEAAAAYAAKAAESEQPAPRMPRLRIVNPRIHAIGQRIRARRMELGLSQAALSDSTGLTQGCITHVENAHYKSAPKGETLAVLALALGTTMDALWFGDER